MKGLFMFVSVVVLLAACCLSGVEGGHVTAAPSLSPTKSPSRRPTASPTSKNPTKNPTRTPTLSPIKNPTNRPTPSPSSRNPTKDPTSTPTSQAPTKSPTSRPTTVAPTKAPTSASPTLKSPTKSPTSLSPTKSPTSTPTKAPSSSPSQAPTKTPTSKSPTKKPTSFPTSQPTNEPTLMPNYFSGHANVDSLDLYVLIDMSHSTATNDKFCKGDSPFVVGCLALYVDFARMFIKAVGKDMGFGEGKKGLRVFIAGFACDATQNIDMYIPILDQLSADSQEINAALDKAAKVTPSGGTCPGLALEKFIANVEDVWGDSKSRPFKMSLMLTDAELYDFSKHEQRQKRDSQALRQRCVETLALPNKIGPSDLTAQQKSMQLKFLKQLAGSNGNIYELSKGEANIIQQIANNAGKQLDKNGKKPQCTNPHLYDKAPKRFCGYAQTMCQNRVGCVWSEQGKCQTAI